MSSALPTRRVTRVTRTTTMKDSENANARPLRATTRAKPPSSQSTIAGGLTRATGATTASRAKTSSTDAIENAAVKRKREALGEVTQQANNKGKSAATTAKGKEKFDGIVLDSKVSGAKVSSTATRQPLRTVAGTRLATRNRIAHPPSALEEVKEQVVLITAQDEHAMVVDAPPVRVEPPSRHNSAQPVARRVLASSSQQPSIRHRAGSRQVEHLKVEEEDDHRAHKKRRTSSEAPEDAPLAKDELEEPDLDSEDATAKIAADLQYRDEAEADPDGDEWDDLDADDADDPLMVSEYVVEIFEFLKETEKGTMPNANYMTSQKELSWKMRGILTDWLVQVHARFRLLPETLFLCINIIDRFLSARVVSLAKYQLVGVTCMFIAAKFEEIVSPSVKHFLHCADSSYTETEILQAERYILKTLDYNLNYPNPVHFLRRISKADDYNVKVRTLGKYLLEIGCVEWRLVACPPSLLAAASIWLARLALGSEQWTPNLAHYSSYPESAIIPTANLMLNYILKDIGHEMFFKKYAAKRFLKSSQYMREWALEHWSERQAVDLEAELPILKEHCRLAREEAEKAEREYVEQQALLEATEAATRAAVTENPERASWLKGAASRA
ncbi:hypothetical protein HGRIS_000339 [Hohenbuehelia grisea]|uniref:Cyclin N-terminal domain-containing protein n=1 Tax=Hohenbuehelia grisea TaxID=104357 RepID=A0ABR3JRJ1_9AGAR